MVGGLGALGWNPWEGEAVHTVTWGLFCTFSSLEPPCLSRGRMDVDVPKTSFHVRKGAL